MTEVWVSDFYVQLVSREGVLAWITSDWEGRSLDFAAQVARKHHKGVPVEADELPKRMIGNYSDEKVGALPDMFGGNGYLVVTEACKAVLSQFDLGNGQFFPIEICEFDRTTQVGGRYFIFNVGNQKSTVVPEQSKNIKLARYGAGLQPLFERNDTDDVAVRREVLEGPAVWIDPVLMSCIFFKNEVVQALRQQNVSGNVYFGRCRVLEDEC